MPAMAESAVFVLPLDRAPVRITHRAIWVHVRGSRARRRVRRGEGFPRCLANRAGALGGRCGSSHHADPTSIAAWAVRADLRRTAVGLAEPTGCDRTPGSTSSSPSPRACSRSADITPSGSATSVASSGSPCRRSTGTTRARRALVVAVLDESIRNHLDRVRDLTSLTAAELARDVAIDVDAPTTVKEHMQHVGE